MRLSFVVLQAPLFAAAVAAQDAGPAKVLHPQAKVPPVEFRSAFDGYRPFVEQERRDWRKANEEVGSPSKPQPPGKPAAGHGGHK